MHTISDTYRMLMRSSAPFPDSVGVKAYSDLSCPSSLANTWRKLAGVKEQEWEEI